MLSWVSPFNDTKLVSPKHVILTFDDSGTHTIDRTAYLKVCIDSQGPGLLFGYFEILLACIVLEIIASF